MKTSAILVAAIFLFAACKKETTVTPQTTPATQSSPPPATTQSPVTTQGQGSTTTTTTTVAHDTIPDKAALKIKLVKDSINYDETMFFFNHTAKLSFDPNEDSPYFVGYGPESLASISSDGRDLVINTLPYSPGVSVGLDVNSRADGAFSLQISYENKIPSNIEVMVKDNYLRDSVNISNGPYKFNVVKSDTTTYGASRFRIVFKSKAH